MDQTAAIWVARLDVSGITRGGFGRTPWVDGIPHGVFWRSPRGCSGLAEVEAKGNPWRFWGKNASSEATKTGLVGVVRGY